LPSPAAMADPALVRARNAAASSCAPEHQGGRGRPYNRVCRKKQACYFIAKRNKETALSSTHCES
jgi:hypothetical protein